MPDFCHYRKKITKCVTFVELAKLEGNAELFMKGKSALEEMQIAQQYQLEGNHPMCIEHNHKVWSCHTFSI